MFVKGATNQITRGLLLLAVIGAFPLLAQHTSVPAEAKVGEATPPLLAFDVVSVKEFIRKDNSLYTGWRWDPAGLTAMNQSLRRLICLAWGASDYQVSGGPDWMDTAYFQIQAKMDDATAEKMKLLTYDQRLAMQKRMLQAVLADRFKLTVRNETKPFPGYALVVAKGGSKLHEAAPDDSHADRPATPTASSGRGFTGMTSGGGIYVFTGSAISLDALAGRVGAIVNGKVRNETGLKGVYDVKLRFTQDNGPSGIPGASGSASVPLSSEPSIFIALQEQLGLKLEPRKEADDALIVEHVEKPTEN
jgi:uncharacterized protein (TIGR03435 family)